MYHKEIPTLRYKEFNVWPEIVFCVFYLETYSSSDQSCQLSYHIWSIEIVYLHLDHGEKNTKYNKRQECQISQKYK